MTATGTVKKYNFKNSFDTNERGIISARDFTESDMARARAEGITEGKAAGMAEARASIEQAATTALGIVGARLGELVNETNELKTRLETESLETVLAITRKLVPHYAKAHGLKEIEGVVRDCLTAVYDEPRVVIRGNQSVLDHIKTQLDDLITTSGFGGKVVLFTDHALGPGDCRVEWADGGTERDVQRLWNEIETSISQFLERDIESENVDQADVPAGGQEKLGDSNG